MGYVIESRLFKHEYRVFHPKWTWVDDNNIEKNKNAALNAQWNVD